MIGCMSPVERGHSGVNKRFAWLSTLVLAVSFAMSVSAQSRKHLCDEEVIPQAIEDLVAQQFSSWRIEDLPDLSDEYQQAWLNKHSHECPGFPAGHFQAPGVTSYAAL